MKFSMLHADHRQDGMALILAIGFLAILSILGAIVLNVATRDLSGTAVTMPNQRALYAADRAIEYSMNRDIIMNLPIYNSINLVTAEVRTADGTVVSGVTHKDVIDDSGPGTLVSGSVTDIGPSVLPPHLAAIHGSEFGANLYHVNVKTTSIGASKPVHIDASIVRLFKLDDDQIFRTSGGG
jgi:hypothetical protein